jgi:hypothetical protein
VLFILRDPREDFIKTKLECSALRDNGALRRVRPNLQR